MSAGDYSQTAAKTEQPTLATRLDKASSRIEAQLSRMISALDRIHGTPTPPHAEREKTPIAINIALACSVERIEQQATRFNELLNRLDQVG